MVREAFYRTMKQGGFYKDWYFSQKDSNPNLVNKHKMTGKSYHKFWDKNLTFTYMQIICKLSTKEIELVFLSPTPMTLTISYIITAACQLFLHNWILPILLH